jgi:hypothetical protein
MTYSDTEPGDTFESTPTNAMWYESILPDSGFAYIVLYVLVQIVLVPSQWLRSTLFQRHGRAGR